MPAFNTTSTRSSTVRARIRLPSWAYRHAIATSPMLLAESVRSVLIFVLPMAPGSIASMATSDRTRQLHAMMPPTQMHVAMLAALAMMPANMPQPASRRMGAAMVTTPVVSLELVYTTTSTMPFRSRAHPAPREMHAMECFMTISTPALQLPGEWSA